MKYYPVTLGILVCQWKDPYEPGFHASCFSQPGFVAVGSFGFFTRAAVFCLAQKPPTRPSSEARKAPKLQRMALRKFNGRPALNLLVAGVALNRHKKPHGEMVRKVPVERKFPQSHVCVGLGAKGHGFLLIFWQKRCQSTQWFQKMFNGWNSNNTTNFCSRILTVGWLVGNLKEPKKKQIDISVLQSF